MIVELDHDDVAEIEEVSPDNTIGSVHSLDPFPEASIFDLNRLQAAIAEYRNRFGTKAANIGIFETKEGLQHLALWPESNQFEAIVVVQRVRESRGDSDE